MTVVISERQKAFYREFLMTRGKFQPSEFGVEMAKADFVDAIIGDFAEHYRDSWSVDELLLHPDSAKHFCQAVRHKHHWFDVPDDIILRSILNQRKASK